MNKLLALGIWLFTLSQSTAVRGEVECIRQTNSKEPLCLELGGNTKPAKPIVIKPGKGCGTNSACGGNMKVNPDVSTMRAETNSPETIELAPKLGDKRGANPALQGTLRDKAAPRRAPELER